MKNIYEISIMLDLYGQLLTRRQYEILDLHCNYDYSLGEIAEHFGITRQGVYDNLKRGRKLLKDFEEKLGLVDKLFEQKRKLQKTLDLLGTVNIESMNDSDIETLECVKKCINEIISGV